MAFCSSCGAAIAEGAKFCSGCGSGTVPSPAGRLRPFGVIMLVIGGFYLLMALVRYNSAEHQFLAAFGGTDPTVVLESIYGFAGGIVGIFLFTSEPRAFLKLNRAGLITFAILMAFIPFLFWVAWLVPGLRERQG